MFILGAIVVLLITGLYMNTVYFVMKKGAPLTKSNTAFVLIIYPIVAIVTYGALVVPRSQLIAEAVTQGLFTSCMYQLFCLCIAYCGGEAELLKTFNEKNLDLKIGPCCCYPCCMFPKMSITKSRIRNIRLLVLQALVCQGLIYFAYLVMWAEEEALYKVNWVYFQPIVIVSLLFGTWGVIMMIKMLAPVLTQFKLTNKFFLLQFVLILAKTQSLLFRLAVWLEWLPCNPPLNPIVYAQIFYNCTMLWEILLLSVIARNLYREHLPDFSPVKDNSPPSVNYFELTNGVQKETTMVY